MKISFIADCHLNKSSYKDEETPLTTSLPFRAQDFMNSLEYMVTKNINEIKPDILLFLGDIYDSFDPNSIVTGFFSEQLKKLSDAKIPVIILVGNHDICSRHHALLPLQKLGLKTARVIQSPDILAFRDVVFMLFPYSIEVEKKIVTIKEQFNAFIAESKIKLADEAYKGKSVIFTGHFGVRGACLNSFIDKKNEIKKTINKSEKDISVDDLDTIGAEGVFLGDYHKYQVLPTKNCLALYPGSIEKTDLSETNDKKGFVVYDTILKKHEFVEYPNVRPMLDISGNVKEINEQIDKLGDESKGAIIRITAKGNLQDISDYEIAQHEISKKLKNKIDPIYVKSRNKLIDEETAKKAEIIEKEIADNGHITETEVIDIVKNMISDVEQDPEEFKILCELAEDIYKTTQMNRKVS